MTAHEIQRAREKLNPYISRTRLIRAGNSFWLEVSGWKGVKVLQTWGEVCKLVDEIEAHFKAVNQMCQTDSEWDWDEVYS